MNILLICLVVLNFLIFSFMVAVTAAVIIKTRTLSKIVTDFFKPPSEKEPSPFGSTVSACSDILARSIVAQAKGFFMGKSSGAVRAENAVAADIAQDSAVSAVPLLGAIFNQFPSLKKTLRRNPQLLDLAMSKLTGGSGGSGGAGGVNNSNHGDHQQTLQPKFKL